MGGLSKSLWNIITNGLGGRGTPDANDLIPFAPQPGTPMVTNIKGSTLADLLAGGGAALDIGLRRKTLNFNDAQIKALADSSVLVEAGQPGKIITLIQALFIMDTTAGVYGNFGAVNTCALGFSDPTNSQIASCLFLNSPVTENITSFTNFFTWGDKNIWPILGPYTFPHGVADLVSGNLRGDQGVAHGGSGAPEIGANFNLICLNGGAGPFTGGDPANSLEVRILYWIA